MDNNNSPEKWNQYLQQWMQCLSLHLHGEPSAVLILHYLVHMQKWTRILSGETGNIISSMAILLWQNNKFWHATYLNKIWEKCFLSCRCQLLCSVGLHELQTCGSQSPDPCRQEAETQVSCSSSLQPAHKKKVTSFLSYSFANRPTWVNQRLRSHYLKIQTIRKHVCYMVKWCRLVG